ncbi:hypothetical protein [Trichlorobacter thiogenes]|nr:hypothetical protein [Trichlorobacter thiogenes]
MLKIRIDVVEDFDHGLKDVFEKRPVAVCIQEQITGITGESVARHIQLLLGNGAPGFVLMHEGNAKAKPVPGLFSYLVDLNAPFEVVCEALRKALQALLGDQWDMVYSAPPEAESPQIELAATSLLADQLVDELIEEGFVVAPPQNSKPAQVDDQTVKPVEGMVVEHDLPGGPVAEPHAAKTVSDVPVVSAASDALEAPVPRDPLMAGKQPPAFLQQPVLERPVRPVVQQQAPTVVPPVPEQIKTSEDATVPVEELLSVFEEKYRSRKRLVRGAVSVLVLLLVGTLLFWMKQRGTFDGRTGDVVKQNLPTRLPQPTGVQPQISAVRTPAPIPQAVTQKADALPSFISQAKPDPLFSSKKPGWSRYQSVSRDYRLFHADGRLRAVQIIAVKDSRIPVSELKQVLRDLTGKDQYQSGRQEHKRGVWLERATLPGQADLLIYRSASNGPIKAVVFAPTP